MTAAGAYATPTLDPRGRAEAALALMSSADFPAEAERLLDAVGYASARRLRDQTGDPADFMSPSPPAPSKDALIAAARSIRLLFQVTEEEIGERVQGAFFEDDAFNRSNARSFLFIAVELDGASYKRGRYAEFTREINKRFNIPAVVLFRDQDGLLTLAFVHRRASKRRPERDVVGNVSLIREINPADPHRAHLDILADLSLERRLGWMDANRKPRNFDGLLDAWLDALDTQELNKRFYRELLAWFERACDQAQFPATGVKTLRPQEHVIRLVTRLLFIWFIKEKSLVAPELFVEEQIRPLLKDYDRDSGDSYYRAVLQNLFFATLNTEIARRGFSGQTNRTHRDFSRYRYRDEMADPDALLDLFRRTPFINGGLFDCLDSEQANGAGGWRLDCFTDNPSQREGYSIPNRLFFGSAGVIRLFDRYKFTVEENTPVEQDVALDPELLGKVFENLLAAYNPETRETARKQTGSYYTPREVVDYMVDEALVAALAEKADPDDQDRAFWRERVRYLLDYADAAELFTDDEAGRLVRAIAQLRILDPAVGSGAFPMSALRKLTLALRRLDPENARWQALQRELAGEQATAAFQLSVRRDRDARLTDISAVFEAYHEPDFGRKLYLVQNSIFGVDVQAVACQIAKLRFFISLVIEQNPTADPKHNYGVHPLPNLETRFVAADTLLALGPQKTLAQTPAVQNLERQLAANRERHFHAASRQEKRRRRARDAKLRAGLSKALQKAEFSAEDAAKVANWDPYDQNAGADWFDPAYMFGVTDGFDVVIGNPPYVQLQKSGGALAKRYQNAGYATFARTGDLYQLFQERSLALCAPERGLLSLITSNSWLKAEYGKATRRRIAKKHTPLRLVEMGKDVFETAFVDSAVLVVRNGKTDESCLAVDMDRLQDKTFPPAEIHWSPFTPQLDKPWSILSAVEQSVMSKMEANGTPLQDWSVSINFGVKTGLNDAFLVDGSTRQGLIAADPKSDEIIKPVARGRDVQRYQARWAGLWLIDAHNGYNGTPPIDVDQYPAVKAHLDKFQPKLRMRQDKGRTPHNLRNCAYHEEFAKEKLVWIELVEQGRFAYDASGMLVEASAFMMTGESLKYLCAVLNARLAQYFLQRTAPTSGMGTLRWKKVYVERIPVPKISEARQQPFVFLVDKILEAKASDANADTSAIEDEIDGLVYDLYGLTDAEIAAVRSAASS